MNWLDIAVSNDSASQEAVRVNVACQDTLLNDIEAHFTQRRGFTLATLNLDHVVKLRKLDSFRKAYGAHSHVTADGNPIVWLQTLAKEPVNLLPGSELIAPIADVASRKGVTVALMGSTAETLALAAERLEARHPGLKVACKIAPPMGFDPEGLGAQDAIDTLKASGARLCFLALGAPKQELFAVRAAREIPEMGFVSIGAGLDFIAEKQVRAPAWVRKLALEWFWRMLKNPARLAGRYAACIVILPRLLRGALRARQGMQT